MSSLRNSYGKRKAKRQRFILWDNDFVSQCWNLSYPGNLSLHLIQCAMGFCHSARIQRKQHDFNFTWQSVKREKGHNSCFKQFRIIEPNLRGWPSAFPWEPTQNKKKKERDALKSIMVDQECVKKLTINTEHSFQ